MAKRMLIDATHSEETRVVVVNGNKLDELDFEIASKKQLKGNIYLAKVTRVEPSLQATFVDYGGNRHGFLAFSEIHPDYYRIPVSDRPAGDAEPHAADLRVPEENGEDTGVPLAAALPEPVPVPEAVAAEDESVGDDARESERAEPEASLSGEAGERQNQAGEAPTDEAPTDAVQAAPPETLPIVNDAIAEHPGHASGESG